MCTDPTKSIWKLHCHYDNGESASEDYKYHDHIKYVYGTLDQIRKHLKNLIMWGFHERDEYGIYKDCTDKAVISETTFGYYSIFLNKYDEKAESWSFYEEKADTISAVYKVRDSHFLGWKTYDYTVERTTLDKIITTL